MNKENAAIVLKWVCRQDSMLDKALEDFLFNARTNSSTRGSGKPIVSG
ncbi:MAG: hypothetical protein JSW48_03475 [Betaproteobacteria bacterium]|nr:MAG: hypothetical protein JSW48_03475 [Betaproteobacteria bacterium]